MKKFILTFKDGTTQTIPGESMELTGEGDSVAIYGEDSILIGYFYNLKSAVVQQGEVGPHD